MEAMKFHFTTELVGQSLAIMLTCMFGIFFVLGIIYLASILLQKAFPGEK